MLNRGRVQIVTFVVFVISASGIKASEKLNGVNRLYVLNCRNRSLPFVVQDGMYGFVLVNQFAHFLPPRAAKAIVAAIRVIAPIARLLCFYIQTRLNDQLRDLFSHVEDERSISEIVQLDLD